MSFITLFAHSSKSFKMLFYILAIYHPSYILDKTEEFWMTLLGEEANVNLVSQ